MKTGNMEKSVNMHSLRPEGRIPAGLHEHGNMMHRVDPLPSSHLNKLTSHDKHHHSYHHHPYHNLQPDMTPKEHLHSLNLRRGKHADGNPSDHYQMYQLAHGNSRTFGKHPSDMEGHRTHAGQWSDLDRFHGQKGSSKWGRSEPHLHHARRDLPEYGISARRMYDDAYDYRKPEWMGQSKPEIVRDRYEANQSPVRHNQNFLSHMGGQPSFSERDWSRRRPDQPSFGAFGQKFF
ncbi:unnamed protein product [Echinostoma caproni]|uniref:Btz domain-containing protein n=1 Tax=Echinostoma caproni TaxID=27848 RepID=A0A183B693_9TREM|nr:unnamed protein product [Echinostoma caproni]